MIAFRPLRQFEVSYEESWLLRQIAEEAGVQQNATLESSILYMCDNNICLDQPIYALRIDDDILSLQYWCHRSEKHHHYSAGVDATVYEFDLADPQVFEKIATLILGSKVSS